MPKSYTHTMANRRVGLWLIGALGNVAASVALGVSALRRGLTEQIGLVTALDVFANCGLEDPSNFTIGGHDIRNGDLAQAVASVGGARPAFRQDLIQSCRPDLDQWSANIRPGLLLNGDATTSRMVDRQDILSNEAVSTAVARVQSDLRAFQERERLDAVVVVNVASTEAPSKPHVAHSSMTALQSAIRENDAAALPASSWYAFAAIDAGFPYVNFTPSVGADLPVLVALARERRVPVAGSDGKTGETLVKTALAPMFRQRNLKVLSWVGHNILGNRDGQVLSEPTNRSAKVRSKDQVVAEILGYAPQTVTSIDCVDSIDDWKTAWDHVHFQGFLGVQMSLQFTWQGSDSALAAPLILDLARLTLAAQRSGRFGIVDELAVFFKNPMGSSEHDLSVQFARLESWAKTLEHASR
ncbi:MAG: inositol-3-phosphate synthase [Gemmataceae bacterium]